MASVDAEVPARLTEGDLSSALARELARLGEGRRSRLQISDQWLVVVEVMYVIAEAYGRSTGHGWWPEVEAHLHAASWLDLDNGWGEEHSSKLEAPPWVANLSTTGWRHLQRAVGAGSAMRLRRACVADLDVWGLALRRGLRDLLPLARALDLCVGTFAPGGSKRLGNLGALQSTKAVSIFIDIDDFLARKLEQHLGVFASPIGGTASLTSLIELLPLLSSGTEERVFDHLEEFGTPLLRKLRGAREVLGATSDDVSQAAHSLTEFIDRLLRGAFSSSEVLAWITTYLPDRRGDLVFYDAGVERPTKLAEALCLLNAGCRPPEGYEFAEAAAVAIVNSRRALQVLKHSDQATLSQRQELLMHFDVVEAAFLLTFQLGWRIADEQTLVLLQNRISVAA